MIFITLDMEGVLIPEIWIEFAKITGYDEFKTTTKDEPDYDKLMRYRLEKLKEHNLHFTDIRKALDKIEPYNGAREFLDKLRVFASFAILSDTFMQFVKSGIEEKLGNPLIFCHELVIENNFVKNYKIRTKDQKKKTVEALQNLGYKVFSSGDSYNDISMIRQADDGGLFRAPEKIKTENKDIKTFESYDEILNSIEKFNSSLT